MIHGDQIAKSREENPCRKHCRDVPHIRQLAYLLARMHFTKWMLRSLKEIIALLPE